MKRQESHLDIRADTRIPTMRWRGLHALRGRVASEPADRRPRGPAGDVSRAKKPNPCDLLGTEHDPSDMPERVDYVIGQGSRPSPGQPAIRRPRKQPALSPGVTGHRWTGP
jgi:hypothetical protein